MGWGILSARNWKITDWSSTPNYAQTVQDIYRLQNPGRTFGTFTVLSPPIADFIYAAGYDTVEKFTEFVGTPDPNEKPKAGAKAKPAGDAAAKPSLVNDFHVVVTGARNNNYWMIGGMRVVQSVQIDPWR
jgi:hypothetical protein